MTVAFVLCSLMVVGQSKPIVTPGAFDKLAAKVVEIGQKQKIEKQLGAFLKLDGKEVHYHTKFDSERQISVFGTGEARRLVFLVPEKPFPEFGKTWAYCVSRDGKIKFAGVCEPREAYKAITDKPANEKAAKVEIDYWLKELELKVS